MPRENSFEATLQEAVVKPLQNFIDRLRRTLSEPAGPDPVTTLQQNAREELRLAEQLRAHMSLMPNELLRETLGHIAAETEESARLLIEQVQAPAGPSPLVEGHEAAPPTAASTIWRLLAADLAWVNALASRYQEQLGWITDPRWRSLLHQLRAVKQRHRRILSDLLTRIDSFAKPELDHREHT